MTFDTKPIGVVIPYRGTPEILTAAIESVVCQTWPNWRLCVVNDYPDDSAISVFRRKYCSDDRIAFAGTGSRGANAARNAGYRHLDATHIVFLDADDLLMPECLAGRMDQLHRTDAENCLVFGTECFYDQPGDLGRQFSQPSEDADLDRFLSLNVPWQTAGVLWPRVVLDKVGGWNESLPSWQDIEICVRAMLAGFSFVKCDRVDTLHRVPRVGSESISTHAYKPRHIRGHLRVLRSFERSLKESGCWDHRRRSQLVGLYYWHLQERAGSISLRDAALVWRACRKNGLISMKRYLEGMFFHRMSRRSPFARRISAKCLKCLWRDGSYIP